MTSSKKVDGMLEQWPVDTILWIRAHRGLKEFKFQTDHGEFNSKACKNLVTASGGNGLPTVPTHLR